MTDPTEDIRRKMLVEINAQPGSREYLEAKHGQVWDTQQLSDDFEVHRLRRPARRRSSQERRAEGEPDVPGITPVLLRL